MQVALENISKSYVGNTVLNGVNLTIDEGQIHALVGENGAGKSTLMKILIGVETADDGQILINGTTKRWHDPLDARRSGLAMVYQELTLVPSLSVVENIFLGRLRQGRLSWLHWSEMEQEASQVLEDLGASLDLNQKIEHLSIADQQLVEIARALAHDAKLIILDEPTSALADSEAEKLFSSLKRLNSNGVSLIYITHRLQEVFEIAHHISVLRDGRLVNSGPVSQVDIHSVVRDMVGRELREQFPARTATADSSSSPVALRITGAGKHGRFSNLRFELRQGEILGLAGLVGAGRTEFLEAIFGINGLPAASIEVFGKELRTKSPTTAVQAGLGLIPDDRKTKGLVTEASVTFNLNMGTQRKYASRFGWRQKKRELAAAERLIADLKIRITSAQQPVTRLSGGNQQKVVIGKTLNTDSRILIFDEPTRGIDVGAKREIYFLLRDLADAGAAIILVSSELEEILGLSDRIIVMHQGRITGELATETATQEAIMRLAVGMQSQNYE
ncbi:MAG: sugar ABC transporter ATP-binding protein [bacterium]